MRTGGGTIRAGLLNGMRWTRQDVQPFPNGEPRACEGREIYETVPELTGETLPTRGDASDRRRPNRGVQRCTAIPGTKHGATRGPPKRRKRSRLSRESRPRWSTPPIRCWASAPSGASHWAVPVTASGRLWGVRTVCVPRDKNCAIRPDLVANHGDISRGEGVPAKLRHARPYRSGRQWWS